MNEVQNDSTNPEIFGTWDDLHGEQFMVYWHQDGQTCSVFMLNGSDYGGGVCKYNRNASASKVSSLLNSGLVGYQLYTKMREYIASLEDIKYD